MLLTPRVTEERKRASSVTKIRVPHIDINQPASEVRGPTADRVATTTDAGRRRFHAAVDGANATLAC
jgi:hypothetical protein